MLVFNLLNRKNPYIEFKYNVWKGRKGRKGRKRREGRKGSNNGRMRK